ncbi:uncharacterized protein Pyn_04615 [Prunus yedoensis var. nudiflora]|uniref:Uncharacterized protein n=1 Tax=Prunus yedoensis var. nudiflora TaxID=2094558 RepID=A0A314ZVZ7_PRUYE|nr:uncharacterized protein Pyn_04615 [Prunus yedoensis var. nudiflora]
MTSPPTTKSQSPTLIQINPHRLMESPDLRRYFSSRRCRSAACQAQFSQNRHPNPPSQKAPHQTEIVERRRFERWRRRGRWVFRRRRSFFNGGWGGSGGGGGGWNFDRFGGHNWDESSSSSPSDPAFDFVYEVMCWIALSNCVHFAFKRVIRIVADGLGDEERAKVPMRLTSVC